MLTIQGQDRPIAQLQRSLAAQRLASTWLFAGPQGVGKFSLAIQLAKTVMCDAPLKSPNNARIKTLPDNFTLTLPCNTCESCRAVDNRSHPDLHIITKELIRYHDKSGTSKGTTISINVIRGEITGDTKENKEAKIYKRSFRGRGKFFIIDQAELMEAPAQNALLKTLEEPPLESYLILITTSPGELLSTIRSRSQQVEFRALPTEVIMAGLTRENFAGDDAALLARLAHGSLGQALHWAHDIRKIEEVNAKAAERRAKAGDDDEDAVEKFSPGGILAWTRQLSAALDQLANGQAAASDLAALISKFAAEHAALTNLRDRLASTDRAKRDGITLLLGIASAWFSDRMRNGLGAPTDTPLPNTHGDLHPRLAADLIAAARTAESDIDFNAHEKILLAATTTAWEKSLAE